MLAHFLAKTKFHLISEADMHRLTPLNTWSMLVNAYCLETREFERVMSVSK